MANDNPSSCHSVRFDWFDGTVVEVPNQPEPSFRAEEDDIGSLSIGSKSGDSLVGNSPKPMGYMKLSELSQQESSTIILRLRNPYISKMFYNLLNTEMEGNFIVLLIKVLTKISSVHFTTKNKILEQVFNTTFFEILISYLQSLPATRISEKRSNMLFWDEPELFYKDVLTFITQNILDFPDKIEKMVLVYEATHYSIMEVVDEHSERFSSDLFKQCNEVEAYLKSCPTEDESDVTDFKKLNIFPNANDLLVDYLVKIEPNIVDGAYSSVLHYLDVQFKLLREDYLSPIREGISSYKNNPDKFLYENIRVYKTVKLVRKHATCNKIGILLDLCESKRRLDSNSFMFGSLILLTKDNFQTTLVSTVLDANPHLLSNGYIVVEMFSTIPANAFTETYIMIESEVYFEPYHQVLKVLQKFKPTDLPFKEYIVDAKPIQNAPAYLNETTEYRLRNNNVTTTPILNYEVWPTNEQLGLDDTQYEAYKLALTREFAVIQGPPGTGKTFIGVRVAKTVLENIALMGTPMLVICFTNHALDQFLEHILEVTKDIVRIGGQSKSEKLEPYTLSNRRKVTRQYGKAYFDKRKEQDDIMTSKSCLQDDILKCDTDIISYEHLKPFLKVGSKSYKLDCYKEYGDPILAWLFEHLGNCRNENKRNVHDTNKKRINVSFSKKQALQEIDSLQKNLKYIIDVSESDAERKTMEDKFLNEIQRIEERMRCFGEKMKMKSDGSTTQTKAVQGADKLTTNDRWSLYFLAAAKVKDNLRNDLKKLEQSLKSCNSEVEELRMLVDTELVRMSKVVGVTTTSAARVHALLQALHSPIVIVEEAAEVLEAHIIASLTKTCQHLILIGDHKQLRPTTACYKLAKQYNLEISLFERMIRNGIHSRILTTQHRMRPEFVDLLVPTIYDSLRNDQSVLFYPDVRGVENNLFFLKHTVFEDSDTKNSWSHSNKHEAELTLRLSNYLVQQGYKPDDVTVLTTYTGQMYLMKELKRSYERLKDVKILVVDNFQGEESKIVVLSLVRSNADCKIGFLSTANRICVALSRAKEGFYIIGNMELLASCSKLWKQINDKLESSKCIGDSIQLYCVNHPNSKVSVKNPGDFDLVPEGGCKEKCGYILKCNHGCPLFCHPYDPKHQTVKCEAPCERVPCEGGHNCPKRCGDPCDSCTARVPKSLPCGHVMTLPCFLDVAHPSVKCTIVVQAQLDCGHTVQKSCHTDSKKIKCPLCKSGKNKSKKK